VPRLLGTQPNQVSTWDVTDLKRPVKANGASCMSYSICSVGYVVGWMLALRESATLAQRLIRTARKGIQRNQLTMHSDRGSIQVAKDLNDLYYALCIVCSLSRPLVSNDSPYSESLFKTTKYATERWRFDAYAHGAAWCGSYFQRYNDKQKHEALPGSCPPPCTTGKPPESSLNDSGG